MKQLRASCPFVLVIGLTILSGVVSGSLTNRWGAPASAKLSIARLTELPDEFGDWQSQLDVPMDREVIELLQCTGHVQRVYRNRETGQQVNAALLLGPAGPISAHTPEVCYSTQDYNRVGAKRWDRIRLANDVEANVWRMQFHSNSLQGETLSVAYAWNAGQGWLAPDSPRFAFAGQPMLFKLQLSTRTDADLPAEGGDACESFLQAFLPVCNATLFRE